MVHQTIATSVTGLATFLDTAQTQSQAILTGDLATSPAKTGQGASFAPCLLAAGAFGR